MTPTTPPPTADTAYEHCESDGYIMFGNADGSWVIWKRNQAVPTGTEQETP